MFSLNIWVPCLDLRSLTNVSRLKNVTSLVDKSVLLSVVSLPLAQLNVLMTSAHYSETLKECNLYISLLIVGPLWYLLLSVLLYKKEKGKKSVIIIIVVLLLFLFLLIVFCFLFVLLWGLSIWDDALQRLVTFVARVFMICSEIGGVSKQTVGKPKILVVKRFCSQVLFINKTIIGCEVWVTAMYILLKAVQCILESWDFCLVFFKINGYFCSVMRWLTALEYIPIKTIILKKKKYIYISYYYEPSIALILDLWK